MYFILVKKSGFLERAPRNSGRQGRAATKDTPSAIACFGKVDSRKSFQVYCH